MKVDKQKPARRPVGFDKICREHGVRSTHQRMEIYAELAATTEHPDAETVYRRVRNRIPSISLDTVYRTLRLFEEKGVISRIASRGGRMRFDADDRSHHHFVCALCGRIYDFYSKQMDDLAPPDEVRGLGEIESVYVELRGVCKKCRKDRG